MTKSTPKQPCQDAFLAAQAGRAAYPLSSGAYKLREAQWALRRMQESMNAIGAYLRHPSHFGPGALVGPCCTTDDYDVFLREIPMRLAEQIGGDILPAIAALTGDGIAKTHVAGELASAEANARRLLRDCEDQHKLLQAGMNDTYLAIKSGHSDLYALLTDACGIVERALQLIEWLEMRASRTEGAGPWAEMWD